MAAMDVPALVQALYDPRAAARVAETGGAAPPPPSPSPPPPFWPGLTLTVVL
jgi:hypothetical protein